MKTTERDQTGYRTVSAFVIEAASGAGPGWQMLRNAPGDYYVRFVPPFRSVPAITTSAHLGAGVTVRVNEATADYVRIINNTAGQGTNFHFSAKGLA